MQSNTINIVLCMALGLYGIISSPSVLAHCAGKHTGNHPHCPGGDDDNNSGDSMRMSCLFADDSDDNITSDNFNHPDFEDAYVDGVNKVRCTTGGTSQPNLSGIAFDTVAKGNVRNAERKLDIHLGTYEGEAGTNDGLGRFESIFGPTSEDVSIAVRPYKKDQTHIQSLTPGDYPMAVRIALKGYGNQDSRVVINVAGQSIPGDIHQGVLCDIDKQDLALTQDATVKVWDPVENGGVPRFTVSVVGSASICSDIPPAENEPCGGADNSNVCNFHGKVPIKFTFDAEALP